MSEIGVEEAKEMAQVVLNPAPVVLVGPDQKPVFTGHATQPPPFKKMEDSKMECPICHKQVDYLVGVDTQDGGRQGCEECYIDPLSVKQS